MQLTIEVAILGVLFCQLLLLSIVLIWAKKRMSLVSRYVRSFLELRGEENKSQFAVILEKWIDHLAVAITASIKGWLLGQNSIAVRQDKAAARAELQASAPPIAQALMKYSPGIGKIIAKNPELAQMAMNAFAGMGGKKEGGEGESDNHQAPAGNPFRI